MKKILIAQFRYQIGHVNASSISTNEIANYLHTKKWRVTVLSPKSKTRLKTKYELISYNNKGWQERELFKNLFLFVRKVNQIKKAYDLIYLIIPNPAFLFIGDLIKTHSHNVIIRSECSFHNFDKFKFSFNKIGVYTFFTHLASLPILGKLSNFPHYCLISTSFQKKELIKIGYPPKKIVVIPNTSQKIKAVKSKKTYNLFSYIGHYNVVKGVHTLVKAISYLVNDLKVDDLKFQFASANNFYQKKEILNLIQQYQIKKYISFHNHVNISEFLSKSKAIILPYIHPYGTQLYPNLILESIQINKPIITSNIKPLQELLINHKTALLTRAGDHVSLAQAILKISKNTKLEHKIIYNSRRLAQKINPIISNQKHLSFFSKMVKK